MTENPYAPLEQAIAAAGAEIRSLRVQRATLQARIDQLEGRLAAHLGDTEMPSPAPQNGGSADAGTGEGERLQQLESEREAIQARLRSLQARLGTMGGAEPEERQNDNR